MKDESNYLIERHQLAANDSVVEKKYNNNVMIIEKDEPLSLLLEIQCKLHNYNVLNLNDSQVILENSTFQPSVIILDAGSVSNFEGVDLCKKIKSMAFYQDAKIILTTIFHDKQTILKSGADLYLPKPYNIDTVISWVKRFNIEYNL
ncbi:MAG: response regulator [Candidatus Melainabacteria bacterium]|nr:MAG: response regulator [Candidatus Melainabacteria bacterium]